MFRARIQSLSTPERSWQAEFDSEPAALEWLELQKKKDGRLPERTVRRDTLDEPPAGYTTSREVTIMDEYVNPETGESTWTESVYIDYTIPAEASYLVVDLDQDQAWLDQRLDAQIVNEGRKIRACCGEVHEYIAGLNKVRELSVEGVQTMQTTFTPIMSLLIALRVATAKGMIQAIVPDDILVTEATKNRVMAIFAKWGQ